MEPNAPAKPHLVQVALYSLLFLFFFQLVSDFVEGIYVFGLLGTSIPIEIVSVVLFLSPLVLLLLPRGLSGWPLVVVGEVMLACRVAEPLLDARWRMLVAGLGVACFLILFPSLLRGRQGKEVSSSGLILGIGLTVSLSLSVLLRALGSGSDVSSQAWTQAVGWILAVACGALLLGVREPERATGRTGGDAAPAGRISAWRTAGLCLGLASVLVLCYFAFVSPTVIARWTGVGYLPIVSIVALMLCLAGLVLMLRPRLLAVLTPGIVLAWNVLFGLSLLLTILAHQVRFPDAASAYPEAFAQVSGLHQIPLFFMLLLMPVVVVDLHLLVQALLEGRPSPRALGGGFGLAGLYLLILVFAQVFTTVYDYIPVAGPFFRDRFWLAFLVPSVVVTLAVLLVRRSAFPRSAGGLALGRVFAAVPVLIALATVAGAVLTAARPVAASTEQESLKILTYNIQQGYGKDGRRNYDGQLAVIRGVDADIVGLQECDTARIANGNGDVVRYMADRLDMYSYYGPKTVHGTFGVALLSKYPIENPRTFYMHSTGEQTATIWAQVTAGGKTFNVFVTHLGNGGPIVQQEAILQEVEGKDNVILLGDFNFRPDSEQYRLTTAMLDDSWWVRWPQGNEGQGVDPTRTIDHIFVSPGTGVAESMYLPGPDSDHPAQTTTISIRSR